MKKIKNVLPKTVVDFGPYERNMEIGCQQCSGATLRPGVPIPVCERQVTAGVTADFASARSLCGRTTISLTMASTPSAKVRTSSDSKKTRTKRHHVFGRR